MLGLSPRQAHVLKTLSLVCEVPVHFPVVSLDKQEATRSVSLIPKCRVLFFSW